MKNVAVLTSVMFAPRDMTTLSLEEALHLTTRSILRDAGLAIGDIDGIVVGSNDQQDGRAISIMMASGAVGGVGRDMVSTPSAGEHAFVLGALRVSSGQHRTQLVLSWNGMEAQDLSDVQRLGTDPYFHRALPLDELSAGGLQAVAIEHTSSQARGLAQRIVVKNRAHGAIAYPELSTAPTQPCWIESGEPLRWPLTSSMVLPQAFGVVATILADEDFVRERGLEDVAWIQGMGWATEASFLGDRDLATLPSLAAASARAYAAAGIQDAAKELQVAEVADANPYQELLAYEGLGLAAREDWASAVGDGRFGMPGALPVNPSGGALTLNLGFCSGLARIAEAANQVRRKAARHQVRGVKRAVAHAASGFAMQYNTVVVFGDAPIGARP